MKHSARVMSLLTCDDSEDAEDCLAAFKRLKRLHSDMIPSCHVFRSLMTNSTQRFRQPICLPTAIGRK